MKSRTYRHFAAALTLALCSCSPLQRRPYPVEERAATDMAADLAAGRARAIEITNAYLSRIGDIDHALGAVLAISPRAGDEARASDARRESGTVRSAFDGIPILVKDNIDVAGIATTAGSLALLANVPQRNAPLVDRLMEAGAVVLGKTNLSEWANIRGENAASGWSAVGGLTRNPYVLDRSACGSSSGSAVAIAANLAAAAIGTETDGSITCPAAMNGLVGLKPTVGLVSRTGIIPISHSQDTAGPMARTVTDAAALLTIISGTDPSDPATVGADAHRADYVKGLDREFLRGARIGVLRFLTGYSAPTDAVFEQALATMKELGATLVDIDAFQSGDIGRMEIMVLLTELKVDLNAYLATTPAPVKTRTLADVIAFNAAEPQELVWFGQELFEQAEATRGLGDPAYIEARETSRRLAGPEGIDRLLRTHTLVALVAPTAGPAWAIDLVNGDASGGKAGKLPAVAGYPHLTVPMGQVRGLPVGLSFIGTAWSEQSLLALGFAFEQATHARRPPALIATLK